MSEEILAQPVDDPPPGWPAPTGYVTYLPFVLQGSDFLGRFLYAFEQILSARPPDAPEGQPEGIEQTIDRIARLFRPKDTPPAFLPWLANWVALTLREDWSEETKRKFLRQVVPLYQRRGTKEGLRLMLKLYLGDDIPVMIYDDRRRDDLPAPVDEGGRQRDEARRRESFQSEPPPHFFQVHIEIPGENPVEVARKQLVAQAIIEQEKPAHTYYGLSVTTSIPTMQLLSADLRENPAGKHLFLGVNTLLNTQTTVVKPRAEGE